MKFEEKLNILARGAGDENIMIMVVIFLMAGAFSASVKAAGGADAGAGAAGGDGTYYNADFEDNSNNQ